MPQEIGTTIFTEKLFIIAQEAAETRKHSNINQEKNGYIVANSQREILHSTEN